MYESDKAVQEGVRLQLVEHVSGFLRRGGQAKPVEAMEGSRGVVGCWLDDLQYHLDLIAR